MIPSTSAWLKKYVPGVTAWSILFITFGLCLKSCDDDARSKADRAAIHAVVDSTTDRRVRAEREHAKFDRRLDALESPE